jgi:hypothetical protein
MTRSGPARLIFDAQRVPAGLGTRVPRVAVRRVVVAPGIGVRP